MESDDLIDVVVEQDIAEGVTTTERFACLAASECAELSRADGAPVKILSGRFGPYVKHGQVNANSPRGSDPAELTLEAAVELLAARVAKAPAAKGQARKAPAAKKTSRSG